MVSLNSAIDTIPIPVSNGGTGLTTLTGIPLGTGASPLSALAYADYLSWTPIVAGDSSAGTCTYTTQEGSYSRVGNVVTAWCEVAWTGHTGTGFCTVKGFPASTATFDCVGPVYLDSTSIVAGVLWYTTLISPSTPDVFYFQGTRTSGGTPTGILLDIQAQGAIRVNITYSVA